MSLVSQALWNTEFPEITKPDGCTYWQFAAMRDAKWAEDDKEWQVNYIGSLKKMQKKPGIQPHQAQGLQELIDMELARIHNA